MGKISVPPTSAILTHLSQTVPMASLGIPCSRKLEPGLQPVLSDKQEPSGSRQLGSYGLLMQCPWRSQGKGNPRLGQNHLRNWRNPQCFMQVSSSIYEKNKNNIHCMNIFGKLFEKIHTRHLKCVLHLSMWYVCYYYMLFHSVLLFFLNNVH